MADCKKNCFTMSPYKNLLIASLMVAASGAAFIARPTLLVASKSLPVNLEAMIPLQFGEWQVDDNGASQVVNPILKQALDRIYAQILNRTYVNRQGYRVMLSIPYGVNQTDSLSMHDPEGCYPAQGFQIMEKSKVVIHVGNGDIPVRRMETLNGSRHELVTYWFIIGGNLVINDWERKKIQIKYSLRREIPDGLLFRASSVDRDTTHAYQVQVEFIIALMNALSPDGRSRIAGLP